jgi:hypothetical protein
VYPYFFILLRLVYVYPSLDENGPSSCKIPGCKCELFRVKNGSIGLESAKLCGKRVKPARDKADKALLPRFHDLPLRIHRSSLSNDFRTASARWKTNNAWHRTISRCRARAWQQWLKALLMCLKLAFVVSEPLHNPLGRLLGHPQFISAPQA